MNRKTAQGAREIASALREEAEIYCARDTRKALLNEAADVLDKAARYLHHVVRYDFKSRGGWRTSLYSAARAVAFYEASRYKNDPDYYRNVRVFAVYRKEKP